MWVWRSICLFIAVLALGLAPASAIAERDVGVEATLEGGNRFVAGEAIVRYERGTTGKTRRAARAAAEASFAEVVGLPRTERVAVDGSVAAAVRRLERQPGVELAQPNYRYEALAPAPDDTFFGELWGLAGTHGVGALPAWDRSTGAGVTIAVLDTGVDLTHPDLAPNLLSNGYDFVDDDGDPDDFHFHGTHVAGTAAAVAGNGLGVAGVAPGARIMPVRVLDGNGEGFTAGIAAGIAHAAQAGARVLNLSLGGPAEAQDHLVSAAIDQANARGAVIVAAAGNSGSDNDAAPTTPCNMPQPNVICVAAINQAGALASFSNYGASSVDVGAPGTVILSAKAEYGAPLLAEDFESGGAASWPKGVGNGGLPWGEVTSSGGGKLITDSPGSPIALYAPAAVPPQRSRSDIASPAIDLDGERGCRVHFQGKYEIEEPLNGALTDVFRAGGARIEGGVLVDARGVSFTGTSKGYDRDEVEEGDYSAGLERLEASMAHLGGRPDARAWFSVQANAALEYDGAYVDDVRVICRGDTYTDRVTSTASWDLPSDTPLAVPGNPESGGGSYFRLQGTSMAAPHVAGVAALVLGTVPGLTAAEAVEAIREGARPLASLAGRTVSGGAVDAPAAIAAALRPPTISIDAPPALGRVRRPAIAFSASRPASFACALDGGAFAPCASPFVPIAPLTEGSHGFVVRATDLAGRSAQSELVRFRIDARRPRVILRKRPPKTVRTRTRRARAVFRLASDEPGVRFICRVNGGHARFCGRRFARRYREGGHTVRVRAADPAGNVTRRAAVYRFRVKRIR